MGMILLLFTEEHLYHGTGSLSNLRFDSFTAGVPRFWEVGPGPAVEGTRHAVPHAHEGKQVGQALR